MEIEQLRELFQEQMMDLYSGEEQIIEAMPDMIEAASDDRLRSALEEHLEETRNQKRRLDEIANELGFELEGHACKGMEGILEEGSELVEDETQSGPVRDAAIIASAQRVEHYEIAAYGTARTLARTLGEDKVAKRLQESLDEEKQADNKLTDIAESTVNRAAVAGD